MYFRHRSVLLAALLGGGLLLVFGGVVGGPALASSLSRTSVFPEPDLLLDVAASQSDRIVTYTVRFDNVGEGVARSVVLKDYLPDGVAYLGNPMDLVDGVWTRTYEDLAPGAYSEEILIELPMTTADGDRIVNIVQLDYVGYSGSGVARIYEHEFVASFPQPPTSLPAWVVAAPMVTGAGAYGGFVAYRRRRGPRFEQVFLMHSSGMLIHHWAANLSPSRDIDILSGMFVILKEFVRDSFREKTGGLTEMQFGDARMFLAEGEHAILAAVVHGEYVNGLPSQIRSAVADFERRHGPALAGWGGQVDHLPEAKDVVENLVHGRYGHRFAA